MSRAIIGSLLFLVAAPGTVAYLGPRWVHGARAAAAPSPLRAAGALLVLFGLFILLDSFARFAIEGLGTPAPVAPTKSLIVTGFYRHVRNPMYVAVVSLILGQGLMWGDARVLAYGAAVWCAFHLFVWFYEEPKLKRSYGAEYDAFRAAVPRWIPRWTAWDVSH
jgi:protein-S-isoprenylcysteine O-methyltransferase Ste14